MVAFNAIKASRVGDQISETVGILSALGRATDEDMVHLDRDATYPQDSPRLCGSNFLLR